MNNFDRQKAVGKKVEDIVKEHLQHRGHKVIDVSENGEFQKDDVDFIVCSKDTTNSILVEVKGDKNISKTKNFFFEIESEDQYGRVVNGWSRYTKADYICFFDTQNGKGYMVDWQRLKPILSTVGRRDIFFDKYDQKITEARLVPIGKLRQQGLIDYEWQE